MSTPLNTEKTGEGEAAFSDEVEPCLVLDKRTGQWRIENRPPIPASIPRHFQWSSELASAAKYYRKHGEKTRNDV